MVGACFNHLDSHKQETQTQKKILIINNIIRPEDIQLCQSHQEERRLVYCPDFCLMVFQQKQRESNKLQSIYSGGPQKRSCKADV